MKQKTYFILPLVAAGAVAFTSCGKKSTEKEVVETTKELQEIITKTVAKVSPAAFSSDAKKLDALAAKAGFAKFLPSGADGYLAIYDAAGVAKTLRGSRLGKEIESLAEEEGAAIDDMLTDPSFQQFADVTGEEIFIGFGGGHSEQLGNLYEASRLSNYYQMRGFVEMLSKVISGGDDAFGEEYLKDLVKDPKVLELFKSAEVRPLYIGFKVSDAEKRKQYVAQLQGFAEMALDEQDEDEKVLVASAKGAFKGFTVKGELFVELMDREGKEDVVEVLGEEKYKQFKELAAKKDIVVQAGEKGEYVVIFVGSSMDQLKFAKSPAESFLADKGMEFAQQYSDKKLLGVGYLSESLMKKAIENQGGLKDMVNGVLAGLKETSAFGDTRVLEVLLKDLVKREGALYARYKGGRLGSVSYLEQGLKIDSYYGGNAPAVDLKSKRHLSKVGAGEGVVFSANWVNDPAQTDLMLEYVDALGSTVYQLSKQVAGLDIEESDLSEFVGGFGMFESMAKEDLLSVWGALRGDLAAGLGSETALVIDINGELPTVPMIPEDILKNAKLPRIAYLSTVDDRKKLEESWSKLNTTAEKLLKTASKMSGENIPMQRPFKSESNGLTNWSFQIPFTHQNCLPSIAVSEKLFIAGSSSDFAIELAKAYEKEATGAPLAEMHINFAPLRQLSTNWLELTEKHAKEFLSESELADLEEALPLIRKFIDLSSDLESVDVEVRQEGKEIHESIHIKVK